MSVSSVRARGKGLELAAEDDRGGGIQIEVRPVAPNIVRLHFGAGATRPSRLLVDDAPSAADWKMVENGEGWSISTSGLTLEVDRAPFRLRLKDATGTVRLTDEPNDRDIRGGYHHFPTGHARGLRWLTARLKPAEALFGLGEHFGALDRRGQAFASWTVDAFGVRSDRAYKNVPFLLSSEGYGVFFDMTEPLHYDLGQASVAAWQATARANHLRAYLIVGDGIASIMRSYHQLTGAPGVPPDWSFGFWISRWGYRNRAEVMEVARRMREEKVPCDVIHIDPYWMRYHEGHHGDLEWDESAFPDPKGMIAELKALGFKLSLWESPYVPLDSEMCAEGERRGFLMKTKPVSPSPSGGGQGGGLALVHGFAKPSAAVDFTNPGAVEWFKGKNRKLLEMGVAVIKTDFAEDMPDDAVPYDGTPAEQLHNLYPLLYQRAVFETTQDVHGYGLIWGRSGYAGSQRYPVHWGGDPGCTFDDMAASLRGALSWILSGAAFASFDMGGFFGIPIGTDPPSPELYVRWSQMGLLFSHARAHGHTAPREPWAYGEPALSIFRRYAQLRYRLLPYLYAAARRAPEAVPLARPLVYDHPSDRTTWHIDNEYLLGPDLLVAPMFEPRGRRDIYLPAGGWYDFWTDQRFDGARWITYDAELETLPLLVRAGSVIPMGPDLQYANERSWDPLSFDVYPGTEGVTEMELADDHRHLRFQLTVQHARVQLDGGPLDYEPAVRVHRPGSPPVAARLGRPVALS
ncbi:MAG TPA: TIM-barrel domain-containing protein [Candidatus Acidoferrum sp.]|nr:TIM-barrel domain-containing protein [Candidatus Acidoferrum sp.]